MDFNDDDHFTLANLPLGIASRPNGTPQAATRLREYVYFLPELVSKELIELDENIEHAIIQVRPLLHCCIYCRSY
jgi:hypothetical protein